jgi:predicted esterase
MEDEDREFRLDAERLFELYGAERHVDALELVLDMRERFPDRDAQMRFFEACLRSVLGDPEAALALLRGGLELGQWWRPEPLRTDPDLAPLRDDPRFADVVEESARRAERAAAEGRPELRVLEPDEPNGAVLFALHGGSGNADEFAPHWAAATASGVLVAAPQSPVPAFPDGLSFWWSSPADAASQLDDHLAAIRVSGRRADRIVLAGLSQGARIALWCAVHARPEPAIGVIAVAGAADLDAVAPRLPEAARRGLRAWFLSGDRDFALPAIRATRDAFDAAGIETRLTVEPGLGHAFPPDFDDRLPGMLDFVLGATPAV